MLAFYSDIHSLKSSFYSKNFLEMNENKLKEAVVCHSKMFFTVEKKPFIY